MLGFPTRLLTPSKFGGTESHVPGNARGKQVSWLLPIRCPQGWPRRCVVPSHHVGGVFLWLCGTTGTDFFQHPWEIAVKAIEASGQNLCYIPVTPRAEAGGCSAQPSSHKTCTWGGFQGYWRDFPLWQGFYLQWMWFPLLETGAGGTWFSPLLLTVPFILLGSHCLTPQGIEDGKGISSAETMASAFMGEWKGRGTLSTYCKPMCLWVSQNPYSGDKEFLVCFLSQFEDANLVVQITAGILQPGSGFMCRISHCIRWGDASLLCWGFWPTWSLEATTVFQLKPELTSRAEPHGT